MLLLAQLSLSTLLSHLQASLTASCNSLSIPTSLPQVSQVMPNTHKYSKFVLSTCNKVQFFL
jgi:hypothetical protein